MTNHEPLPHPCEAGIESHDWQLCVSDGELGFYTECVTCRNAVEANLDVVVAAIPVRLAASDGAICIGETVYIDAVIVATVRADQ